MTVGWIFRDDVLSCFPFEADTGLDSLAHSLKYTHTHTHTHTQPHMCTRNWLDLYQRYGEGTYFSSDLSVCMGFIAAGQAWERSVIGSRLSCVAVCDVVKHPSVTLPGGLVKRELVDSNSVGGDRAPDTYVVVPNNDHIRVRYLFVYAEQPAARRLHVDVSAPFAL